MTIRFVACAVVLLLSACVSSKKYQALTNRYTNLSQRFAADTIRLSQKNEEARNSHDSLKSRYTQLENNYLQLKNDSIILSQTYRRNKALLDELFEKYDKLDKSYKQLSGSISSDALNLTQDVSQKQKELLILEQKLLAQQSQNDRLNMELQEREARLIAFENSIQKMNKTASDLKSRIEKAQVSTPDSIIKIEQRAGRVVIGISEAAMFTQNPVAISIQGSALLKKIASVFKNHSGFNYIINTTSPSQQDPFSSVFSSEIFKFFLKEGVTLNKITISTQNESKAVNNTRKSTEKPILRSIEIIADPKLDGILQSLQYN